MQSHINQTISTSKFPSDLKLHYLNHFDQGNQYKVHFQSVMIAGKPNNTITIFSLLLGLMLENLYYSHELTTILHCTPVHTLLAQIVDCIGVATVSMLDVTGPYIITPREISCMVYIYICTINNIVSFTAETLALYYFQC